MTGLAQLSTVPYELPEEEQGRILSPALFVYLDFVRENLARMQALLGGNWSQWRPHIKTTKIPAVYAELLHAGVRQFKCATTKEAAVFLEAANRAGFAGVDLLVAYPHVEPALSRLRELALHHADAALSVLCEDPEHVSRIPAELSIFADVNPGMNRTGVPMDDFEQVVRIAAAAGGRFRGLHYYDGHIKAKTRSEREQQAYACYQQLLTRLEQYGARLKPFAELITSGTPAFPHALSFPGFRNRDFLHRVSPGTIVFHDTLSAALEELDFVPAALVFSRVISHPLKELVTCDAGSKSLAAEAGHPCAEVLGHPELIAQKPSEEHLPLRCVSNNKPARGQPLLLVPKHVCPTVNLAEQAILIDQGRIKAIVEVSARAHEVTLSGRLF